jgi:hypothetical protein
VIRFLVRRAVSVNKVDGEVTALLDAINAAPMGGGIVRASG